MLWFPGIKVQIIFLIQLFRQNRDLSNTHFGTPSSKGGPHSWLNLVTACKRCNAKKGDHTPQEADMYPRHRPYRPTYALFLRDNSGFGNEWDEYLR
ncbi:MAG TPA: HNH endonuclease [Cyclobacteriaceae bacterium]|nr:HNH endonuclease [Cyclobacteriaceae bacterium]